MDKGASRHTEPAELCEACRKLFLKSQMTCVDMPDDRSSGDVIAGEPSQRKLGYFCKDCWDRLQRGEGVSA